MLALTLTGCSTSGDSSEPTAEPTTSPAATPVATPAPTLAIGEVIWSTSASESAASVESLAQIPRSTEVIFAGATVSNAPAGTELSAVWTIDGLAVEGLSETVTIEDGAASGWVSFSLTWEGETLWPVGQLGVTITADSGESTTGTVMIVS
jgi:hypothetical protein